eukprot:CAMPEP_0185529900 /NCGR_PEP_ID=MMETSP1366-20130426/102590_1 /TAXON_ID=38817 /ORGANISM="Gephyrocapsa oceanica, Strain RCC1303" /LENGTH=328 /DNA_ID=CAMNT_0028141529 /DNA_START=28 /DNA_END=1012 /DNA_ORIENTATION=-
MVERGHSAGGRNMIGRARADSRCPGRAPEMLTLCALCPRPTASRTGVCTPRLNGRRWRELRQTEISSVSRLAGTALPTADLVAAAAGKALAPCAAAAASLHVEHDVLRVPRRPPRPRLERRINPVECDAEPGRDGDQSDHVAKGVVAVRATKRARAEPVSDDEARVVHPRQPERRRGPPNQRPEACGGGTAHQVVSVEAAEDVPPSERGVEELADKAGDKDDAGEGTEGEGMDGARSRQQPRKENLVADARAKLVLEFAGVALVEGALVDARPPPRVEALYVHPSGSARTVAGPEKRVGGGVDRVKANAAAGLVVCHIPVGGGGGGGG